MYAFKECSDAEVYAEPVEVRKRYVIETLEVTDVIYVENISKIVKALIVDNREHRLHLKRDNLYGRLISLKICPSDIDCRINDF
ncbi:MAG: hypothetical protein ACI9Y7_001349 [Dokdonia sp.]